MYLHPKLFEIFLKSESQNMLNFKTNVWDTKKLEIKKLINRKHVD
jgi:hypothetical protein